MFLDEFSGNSPFKRKQPAAFFSEVDLVEDEKFDVNQIDQSGLSTGDAEVPEDFNEVQVASADPQTIDTSTPIVMTDASPESFLVAAVDVGDDPIVRMAVADFEKEVAAARAAKQPSEEEQFQQFEKQLKALMGSSTAFGRRAQADIEEVLLESGAALQRLNRLQRGFQEKFQQLPGRISNFFTQLFDKSGFIDITESDKKSLTEFAEFKADAISNINLYIQMITGAAMGIQEAKRLRKAVPDPGEGVFDGDSPATFVAKLNQNIRVAREVRARAFWMKSQGIVLNASTVEKLSAEHSLDKMAPIMENDIKEVKKLLETENPTLSDEQVNSAVASVIAQRYGLIYTGGPIPNDVKISDAILNGGINQ